MRKGIDLLKGLKAAEKVSREVGALMRREQHSTKRAHSVTKHDIKLDLDVHCQKLIERSLHTAFPEIALLGEEGESGDAAADYRWVVDPIDGTVNFSYGIPHACVSIALQGRSETQNLKLKTQNSVYPDGYKTLLGVVYDPFCDELWTAIVGQPAYLNGKRARVSRHKQLGESIASIGFAKSRETIEATLPYFNKLVRRVRKIRMMGSAALALTYVASGRFDAYIEGGISLWDIAAGGLILECAGGEFWRRPNAGKHAYRMIATNGLLRRTLRVPGR